MRRRKGGNGHLPKVCLVLCPNACRRHQVRKRARSLKALSMSIGHPAPACDSARLSSLADAHKIYSCCVEFMRFVQNLASCCLTLLRAKEHAGRIAVSLREVVDLQPWLSGDARCPPPDAVQTEPRPQGSVRAMPRRVSWKRGVEIPQLAVARERRCRAAPKHLSRA